MLLSRGQYDEFVVQTGRFDCYVATAFSLMHAYNGGARCPDEMLAAGIARRPAASTRPPLEHA